MTSLIRTHLSMLCCLLAARSGYCGSVDIPSTSMPTEPHGPNWVTGERVNLGGVFFPHFHFNAVYGGTTIEDGHEAAAGHHDPITDGWTIQGFEAGLSGRFGDHFEAFGVGHLSQDAESKDWTLEAEEYFGKLKNLPGGLELRGGRYLNRIGLHNAVHQHGWDVSDNDLMSGRILGDDGLFSMGGELSWTLPLNSIQWQSVLSLSVGDAQPETHEEHAGKGPEPRFEADEAAWHSTLTTINWTTIYNLNDFHQFRFGASAIFGENGWDRQSTIVGAHASYQWRENGLELGGRYSRWNTEVMYRDIEALTTEVRPKAGSFSEWGFYTQAIYGAPTAFAGPLEMGLRTDYVQGVSDADLPERWRLTPSIRLFANAQRTASLALHYNYDDFVGHGSEHSLWLSFGLNWGGPEVR